MNRTPFPARPVDVVALTAQEFTCDLDPGSAPSIDVVCSRFEGDANRALVWLIRFRALTAWCARADASAWLNVGTGTSEYVCEVAARFELNDRWEFDAERFSAALDLVVRHGRNRAARR